MLPTQKNYSIWPAVVPADKPVTVTVCANERAFMFREGEECEITVISEDLDEPNYYEPTTHRRMTATASGGALRFETVFEGEQAHTVLLSRDGKKPHKMSMYSLYPDLYELTPLRGDLHAHSFRSDGSRDPAALAGHYREMGYDFFALTDHNRYYPGGEIDEVYSGVNMSLFRVLGEEVHTPGSMLHIVHVCGNCAVTDVYVHEGERYEREVAECRKRVPESVPEKYRDRYARAMWATEAIHAAGGIAIFPHPYWKPGASGMHNVCEEFARILLKSGMFDAYELLGGMLQDGNNRSVALWQELRVEGYDIPVVGSSDVHGIVGSYTFPNMFNVCFLDERSNDGVYRALKRGMCVAVEAEGYEYDRKYRCYGSSRLVSYAQFLLKNYFPNLQRICQGEGVAMRAYAMDDATAELVELLSEQSRRYCDRFFGRTDALLPTERMLEFEDRWREVQLRGPLTCGGTIKAPPITRRI